MSSVYVGLSGGVDSAVSAYLLKKQGHKVVGAFIKGWEPDFLPCTGAEDKLSAMRVAAHLGVPFVSYDLGEEYKKAVVDYFVSEYAAGRTPNPDVMCNREIKFGAFWEKARADGADFIATGHYAQNINGEMHASVDTEKDQTYFLWTLTKEDLAHTLFPVGGMEKSEVRRIAKEAGLPNALRKDSQGLCFLGHVDMKEFLKRYIPSTPGVIKNENGEVVGGHEGVVFYTLGQHITLGGQGERLYVVEKNMNSNELIVSTSHAGQHPKKEHSLTNVNWIEESPDGNVLARYRYRQPLIRASISGSTMVFAEPQLIAPGQSVVFYSGEKCLGGAVINQ